MELMGALGKERNPPGNRWGRALTRGKSQRRVVRRKEGGVVWANGKSPTAQCRLGRPREASKPGGHRKKKN